HVLAAERLAGGALAGRVADHPGEVADQEHHLVAEVLELAHLVQQHRVAQVQVGGGRVEPGLDPQRAPQLEPGLQLLALEDLVGAAGEQLQGGGVEVGLGHGIAARGGGIRGVMPVKGSRKGCVNKCALATPFGQQGFDAPSSCPYVTALTCPSRPGPPVMSQPPSMSPDDARRQAIREHNLRAAAENTANERLHVDPSDVAARFPFNGRWTRRDWAHASLFATLGALVIGLVPACSSAMRVVEHAPAITTMALPLPPLPKAAQRAEPQRNWEVVRVEPGQTLGAIFQERGIPAATLH